MNNAEKIEQAKKLREFIEANAALLTDDAALDMPHAFPRWLVEIDYEKDERVRYGEKLFRCLQNHKSQATWTPEAAPSLWAEILPGQDDDIGIWEQPDSTNPYMKGDKVYHNEKKWESDIDNNVWEPGVYGWSELQ